MRIEGTDREDVYKVWMTDDEFEGLRRFARTQRDDIILQMGGYVGLRAFEIPQIKPKHVKRRSEGEHYRVRVPEGKDTKNGTGEPRDAYLPSSVERDLYQYQNSNDIGPEDPFIDLSTRGVRGVVERVAERAAEELDPDYQHVSSHDLRRRFAQRLLVEEDMNPRVVMAVGGWSSFQAIEPYLNAPTDDVIDQEFENAGLA